MANVLDLEEFKQVLKMDYEEISERVEYIINELFDEKFSYAFEDFNVYESFFELESLAPKDSRDVAKLKLTDYSKHHYDEFVSVYVEVNDHTNPNNVHGSKKEGLSLNFYKDNDEDIFHQINHINFKRPGKLVDLVNNFKKKYGDNTITNLKKNYILGSISLSKN